MNKPLKKIIVLTGILLFCFHVAVLSQNILLPRHPVVVAGNWHVYYTGRDSANDFHICGIIESINKVQPKLKHFWAWGGNGGWYLDEYTIEKVPNHSKNWYFTAHFQTDKPITAGMLMHFGLTFTTNYCNTAVVNCAYWTNYKRAVGRMPLISFKIYGNRLRLINTAAIPMVLNTVELAIVSKEVALEDMFTKGLGDPGKKSDYDKFGTIEWHRLKKDDKIVIKPDSELDLDLKEITGREKLADGDFLLIRGNTIHNGKKLPWWLQHEDTGDDIEF